MIGAGPVATHKPWHLLPALYQPGPLALFTFLPLHLARGRGSTVLSRQGKLFFGSLLCKGASRVMPASCS